MEKVILQFPQTVENALKVCYNEGMKDYTALITEAYREKFERFRSLLLEYNARFNLTSLTEEREVLYKHFYDSVAGEQFFPMNANVCEVGSGAGFPSVPLKIVRGDLKFTCIESTGKKCDFLNIAARELGFSDFSVLKLRAEEAGGSPEYRERFDVSCARAVARLNTLVEYCLPLVKVGGRFIAYKGDAEEEITEAEKAVKLLGGRVERVVKFSLPEGFGERTLVIIHKEKPTPAKYPRGRGKERSQPIV